MAIFRVEKISGERVLLVKPDRVTSSKGRYVDFIWYQLGDPYRDSDHELAQYNDRAIREFVDHLPGKVLRDIEVKYFRRIFLDLFAILRAGGEIDQVLDIDGPFLTVNILNYKKETALTKRINGVWGEPTEQYRKRHEVVFIMTALQHVICAQDQSLGSRIPTVN